MKVSIIIPFYNNWYLTHQRMMELYRVIPTPCEVILVDDCSTEDITGAMGFWRGKTQHSVKAIKTPRNLGFGGAMNHGCRRATEDVYVLLSNDVQVLYNFVPDVIKIIESEEKVLVGNEFYTHDTGWNVLNINGKPKIFPYLAGYFLACTKDAWKDLGGFDDIFGLFDYEDVDLSTTALYKGYKLIPINSKMLVHFSGQTVRKHYPERETITRRNQKKFIGKWSKILEDE